MPHFELTWSQAAILAGVLAVLALGLVWTRRPRLAAAGRFTGEAALLVGLFALWQYAGSFSFLPASGALPRGQWLWHAERWLHLPSETALQRVFLPHPLLIQLANLYYAVLHFPVLLGTLAWLFVWHRDRYRPVRTTVVLFTAAALVIQFVPVAPPRLLPGTGLVDTAMRYGQSVYGAIGGFDADQFSAMPSVHVGWSIIVALAVVGALRSPWRWLAVLYPVLTTTVVVVTANHYWLDGIVAGLLVAAALAVQRAGRAVRLARLSRRAAEPGAEQPRERVNT
ncbi:MAG TPA: phosphatase PAP2 family protein [Streptosporangiaceae bacterium]|nr:phosphatase PAP2 family protein [Streptosporangiaceae bacterium]